MCNPIHYKVLIFILSFYLAAQIFQQYVTRLGPLSDAITLEEIIVKGEHPLNYARLCFILFSMFLMVPGAVILAWHFFNKSRMLSIMAAIFFLFFCLFEISYRSIQLFQTVMIWGKEYAQATPEGRVVMLPKFHAFYDTVHAIYFPLLSSLLVAAVCLFIVSAKEKKNKALTLAMGIHIIQQLSRLSGYTPFGFLNIFSGIWYFIPVGIAFSLSIYWSVKMYKESLLYRI